jgi:choice-of-anchor B domain-containing protein
MHRPLRGGACALALLTGIAVLGLRDASAHEEDPPPPPPPPPPSVSDLPCVGGLAGDFPCSNVDLLAYVALPDFGAASTSANDIWGWTDPETGIDYALLGLRDGLAFVELADPRSPVFLGKLPSHTAASLWRDVEVRGHHALVVSEAAGHGMQVFDLRQLAGVVAPPLTFTATAHYAGFGNAHTLAVNEETGFAYALGSNTCAGGLHMVDVTDPLQPAFAGCFSADGYTHDAQCVVYHGPDLAHQGRELCFASNTDTLTIVDVTVKGGPVQISRTGYAGVGYTHQGWLTPDHAFFLLDDEWDEAQQGHPTRTRVWDVRDLEAPFVTGHHDAATEAIDHNQYVRGDHVFQGNYRAGVRILRLGDLEQAQLGEVAFFDTFPLDDEPAYAGVWSVYPFFASGVVIASDMSSGLFVLAPDLDAVPRCADGLDNDGDGLTDHGGGPGNDPGCQSALAFARESPQCDDGADNDGDGAVDFPADTRCRAAWDDDEARNPGCGLGFEAAAALALLGRLRQRVRRLAPGAGRA